MEVIHLLRKWRSAIIAYKNIKKYEKVAAFRELFKKHQNLEAIVIKRNGLILELANHIKFEWDIKKPNSYILAIDENYEALERAIIKKIIANDDTVFDIGANFGYFTILMKKNAPSINLYSFEPIKDTYATLLRNLNHNEFTAVKAYNFGFSNENANVTFYIPEQLGDAWASLREGVSSVYNYKLRQELAKVCKLDDFVNENNIARIDFIKCDVEGAEKLVIEGGMDTIKRDLPTLMLEIGNMWTAAFGYNREMLISLMMEDLKYRCFGILEQQIIELKLPEEVNQHPEEKMYNCFFVHSSRPNVMKILLNSINTD